MTNFINKLFGKKDSEPQENTEPNTHIEHSKASTAPLSDAQIDEIAQQDKKIEPPQFIVGAGHHVGRQRENNQDSIFTNTGVIATNSTSLPFGIFIVADGMGGHLHGELASEQTVRTMGLHLVNKVFAPLFGPDPQSPEESFQEILRTGVFDSHQAINKHASGGGTTLTAVLVIGTQMTIAHVGDSRAYSVFLDGRMQLLTKDHSMVKRLEDLGHITPEEAENHPQKSMLYRALGQGDAPEPEVFTATMPSPGFLMICSDGLWGVISNDEIYSIITAAPNINRACQDLIDATNAAGGPDNISVILAKMTD
jgi:serine/threonine protein phosphatase PrpC